MLINVTFLWIYTLYECIIQCTIFVCFTCHRRAVPQLNIEGMSIKYHFNVKIRGARSEHTQWSIINLLDIVLSTDLTILIEHDLASLSKPVTKQLCGRVDFEIRYEWGTKSSWDCVLVYKRTSGQNCIKWNSSAVYLHCLKKPPGFWFADAGQCYRLRVQVWYSLDRFRLWCSS